VQAAVSVHSRGIRTRGEVPYPPAIPPRASSKACNARRAPSRDRRRVWLALRLDGPADTLEGVLAAAVVDPLCSARSAGRKPALERDLALDHLERCSVEIANALRRVVVGEDDAAGRL